jgi:hypothetical protein
MLKLMLRGWMWFIILGVAGVAHAAQNAPAVNSRYVIQGDTVYDKKTDLTWQRCSVGQRWAEGKGCVGVTENPLWGEEHIAGDSDNDLPSFHHPRFVDSLWFGHPILVPQLVSS